MTSSQNSASRPLRLLLVIVWAVAAVAAGVAIIFGALTSALNGAGFETRFSNPTPLFILCLAVSLAAGAGAILLGGRWWTAPLAAAPALIFGATYLFSGSWASTALFASPLIVCAGIVCVLVLPRHRAGDRRATLRA